MAAFNSFIRRASASIILPLKIRSVGRVICSTGNVIENNRHLLGRQFLPFLRFTTTTNETILDIIDADYAAKDYSNMMIHIPEYFPFVIDQEETYHKLRKETRDETIEIEAQGIEVIDDKPTIQIKANVLRETQKLMFEITAQPDNQIHIRTCKMKNDKHLKCFEDYLEIRGFNNKTINFLFNWFNKQIPSRVTESCNVVSSCNDIVEQVPDGFPFEIQYADGDLFLKRQFEDQIIEAQVHKHVPDTEQDFRITVKIVHGDVHINFEITGHSDPIFIREMSLRYQSGHLEAYETFWKTRGIKPSTTKFLFDYFRKIDELKERGISKPVLIYKK